MKLLILIAVMLALIACGSSDTAEPVEPTELSIPPISVLDLEPEGKPINPPRPLPVFDLLDQDRARFTNNDLGGKHALISFAYTSCPDVCPVLFGQFLQVQEKFAEHIGENLELVIITVDPEVDSPERLADRTHSLGGQWSFLSGSLAELEPIWLEFRVRVEKEGNLVGHTGLTYLVDDQGLLKIRYPAYTGADQFVADLDEFLGLTAIQGAAGAEADAS